MRTLGGTTAANQSSLNREPVTQIVLRDMILRWKNLTAAAYSTGYPSELDGSMPWMPLDAEVYGSSIYRAWCVGSTVLRVHRTLDPTATVGVGSWADTTVTNHTTDGAHRPSLINTGSTVRLFFGYSNDIRYADGVSPTSYVLRANVFVVDTDHIALAAVSTSVVYMLNLHKNEDFKYLSLHRVTSSAVVDCPHTIIVDGDYDEASLTWFDAETFDGKDIIVINEKAYGHPVVVVYDSGVWTQPRPLLPQDIVDNYTYLRIGSLSVIEDYNSENVLWAVGRKAFGGSSGVNTQEYDLAVRSKDGTRWSCDRYSYLCSTNVRGKLMTYDGYVYYPNGATVKQARQPYSMNNDHADLKHTVEADVIEWSLDQPQPGTACKGTLRLADANGTYKQTHFDATALRWETKDNALAVHPGMWLWRNAGYGSADTLMSIEMIDTTRPGYKAGDRVLDAISRDMVMRLLRDWRSAQDWQWLSQAKHYDDCDEFDALYSIGAATIDVPKTTDAAVAGEVEEKEITEEPEDEPNTGLKFQKYNEPGIFLTTTPFDARNFVVRQRFTYTNTESGDPHGLGSSLLLDTESAKANCSLTTTTFTDTGQDFSDWNWLSVKSATYDTICTITVIFDDSSIAWGFITTSSGTNDRTIKICTQEVHSTADETTYAGWNGDTTSIASKTVERYYVGYLPRHQRLGYGAGVVGCVKDSKNLIACFFDMVDSSPASNGRLLLLVRRDYTNADGDKVGVWLLANSALVTYTPSQSDLYEIELRRSGKSLEGRAIRWTSTPSRTELQSTSFEWGREERMIPVDDATSEWGDPDRSKVGIICNLQVAETKVAMVLDEQVYIIRGLSNWPLDGADRANNAIVVNVDYADARSTYPWTSYTDFVDGSPLWINDEQMTIQEITQSDLRGMYYYMYKTYDPDLGIMRTFNGAWGSGETGSPQDWSPSGWDNDGGTFAFLVKVTDGAGVGAVGEIVFYDYTDMGSGRYRSNFELSSAGGSNPKILDEDYANVRCSHSQSNYSAAYSYFMVYPGFKVARAGRDDYSGFRRHPHNSIAREHYQDTIQVRGVWAYDDEYDKTLEWVLKDIATKAGVLDFSVNEFIDESFSPPTGNPTWLQDVDAVDVDVRDFDITIDLGNSLAWDAGTSSGDEITLLVRANSKLANTPISGNLTNFSAAAIVWHRATATSWRLTLNQTSASGTNEDSWVRVERVSFNDDDAVDGTKLRIVGYGEFFAVYIDDRWLHTLHAGPIFGNDQDGYDLGTSGYIGVWSDRANANGADLSGATYTQPELYTWTDGKILDQRMNAVAGLNRVIGDRRIKYQSTQDGTLKIAQFRSRSSIGSIGDLIYDDSSSPTDAVPTHIRAVGSEISEYVDHDLAARYGLLFIVADTPELDESAAYVESELLVKDATARAGGRKLVTSGQLDWEPEDSGTVSYTPADGGAAVSENIIVDSANWRFKVGSLVMSASVREDTD